MMKIVIPLLLAVIGAAGGAGAGYVFDNDAHAEDAMENCGPTSEDDADDLLAENDHGGGGGDGHDDGHGDDHGDGSGVDYVKLNNQFVVPILEDELVGALVVLSLSLEVQANSKDEVYAREPRLRDSFLQVLFEHANSGGFGGDFTNANKMLVLRTSLLEVARKTLGHSVTDVLIQDLIRQDL